LFYRTRLRRQFVAKLDFSDGITVESHTELFGAGDLLQDDNSRSYSVHSDGRILAVWRGSTAETPLIWIEDFFAELERRFAELEGR
jgi:hypothetical protein